MGKGSIPLVNLSSGQAMPVLGLGTVSTSIPSDLATTLTDAIEAGYRHFDTASIYGTEQALGRAIAEAIRQGLLASRDELFVTSKLWCSDADSQLVLPALQKSLKNLGLDYLDLYLVHWPVRVKPGKMPNNFTKEDIIPFDMKSTWEEIEQCCRLGLAKYIGVSNFSSKKLSQLLEHATIPPAVNQVEMNTSWDQRKLRELCRERGVYVTAWSPLGANGAPWGSPSVMQSPVLKEIATTKEKTVAQVALRWLYEQGVSIVVKSYNKERMKENLKTFDWELDEDDLKMIHNIPQKMSYLGEEFVSEDGLSRPLRNYGMGKCKQPSPIKHKFFVFLFTFFLFQ
ncbi:methylecgonone reductase-like isoform X2 [Iris pallida]|uniref:Methylecgonone reductase-like isoform X2 n=1 Tax=Iris pallida TaxID=29817 RepID=A0AAX6G7D2_IRIPA|nr:methylecgonone reductase-like isoform X2 [Iris pallida]